MRHCVSPLPALLMIALGIVMVVVVAGHVGDGLASRVGQFAPLLGAFLGGSLTLWSARLPANRVPGDSWQRKERVSWLLIGAGSILWGVGECFWRSFLSQGQAPFPSLADIGHASFPLLVFVGLLLQPSPGTNQRRVIVLLDGISVVGTIFALAWYFALGGLALAADKANPATFLAIYYPASDAVLLSCVGILLLRGQRPLAQWTGRHVVLVAVEVGLGLFAVSDFVFNTRQTASSSAEATVLHLGWPLGLMIIGIAAYFHRFPLIIPTASKEWLQQALARWSSLNPLAPLPSLLLACQFVLLLANGLAVDHTQQGIRPVLLIGTLLAVCLVIARLTMTMWENRRVMQRQATLLKHQRDITALVSATNAELESSIDHLQEVLTELANGNLQARANLPKGNFWPLAQSINILANRLARAANRGAWESSRSRAASSGITDRFPAFPKPHDDDQEN